MINNKGQINPWLYTDDVKHFRKNRKQITSLIKTVIQDCITISGMEFGTYKGVILVMRRGQLVDSKVIELPNGQTLKALEGGESYKYLKVLESARTLTIEMEAYIEYIRRVRKLMTSKPNGLNLVKVVNTWEVLLLRN